jgi:hypothetical protein
MLVLLFKPNFTGFYHVLKLVIKNCKIFHTLADKIRQIISHKKSPQYRQTAALALHQPQHTRPSCFIVTFCAINGGFIFGYLQDVLTEN